MTANEVMFGMGAWMLVFGVFLRHAFNRNHDLGYGLGAMWLIGVSILPFLLAVYK